MTNEEQILAALEELSIQITDLKKASNQAPEESKDVEPIMREVESSLRAIKDEYKDLITSVLATQRNTLTLRNMFESKMPKVVHTYVEIKNPRHWVYGFFGFFTISIFIFVFFFSKITTLNKDLELAKANDIKYRLLKVQNESLSKFRNVAENTYDLTLYIDNIYKSDAPKMEQYVIEREQQIRQAFEASEIARLKEMEARAAKEAALKLKEKLDRTE